jgi:SAM-dependent methyltransferase
VADFAASDAELAATLDSLDGADNYAAWICALVRPYLGSEVLELGAGHGTFTERLAPEAGRLVAVDLSDRCVAVLRERFGGDRRIEVREGDIESAAGSGPYDSAVVINVLEHIEDDDEALRQLAEAIKPGGHLILWVPAFPALYSEFDRKIGHYRRYRRRALRSQLEKAGYQPVEVRYVNLVGGIGWLIMARWLRRPPTVGTAIRLFDAVLVPVLSRWEPRRGLPFGQSVFAVAKRP